MNEELTYDEQYKVKVEITLAEFMVEYAGCGSHEMLVSGETRLEHLQDLYEYLSTIKGIRREPKEIPVVEANKITTPEVVEKLLKEQAWYGQQDRQG